MDVNDGERRRYPQSLFVLYGAALVLLGAIVLPLWKPLVLAAALAGPLSGWHDRAAARLHGRRSISALLFTLAVVILILVPIGGATALIVDQAIELVDLVRGILERKGVPGLLTPLPDALEGWLRGRYEDLVAHPRAALSEIRVWSRTGWVVGILGGLLGALANILLSTLLMLIALFFLLRDGRGLVDWLRLKSPVPSKYVDLLLEELSSVSKSVIGGNVLTGLAQSAVATVGYLIAGAPSAALLGLLTFIASFIPSVGTAIVGVPVVGLLILLGRGWWALFLAVWMVVAVGLTDNVLRPVLMRGRSKLHGSLIFFSLFGGALAFGAIGLVIGPLGLAFFLAMSSALRRLQSDGPSLR